MATNCAVCGMTVDPSRAPKEVFKGETYVFCSASCQDRFRKFPERYASGAPQTKGPTGGGGKGGAGA